MFSPISADICPNLTTIPCKPRSETLNPVIRMPFRTLCEYKTNRCARELPKIRTVSIFSPSSTGSSDAADYAHHRIDCR
ncbi:hypothetical protein B0H19DRAFT_1194443 [Mycena capillaripes]|nr:hypothetical protein B0H19DRAFT_1194443 [Mycena capillaripes]